MGAAQEAGKRSRDWRMFSNTLTVGVFVAAVKVAGAVKVIVTARYFGAGDAADAFLIAFLLPSFFADAVAGCLTPSIVPVLARSRVTGIAAASEVARAALGLGIAMMTLTASALALAGPYILPLLGSSFTGAKLRLTTELFLVLLIWLPLSACIATWRAVLNVTGSFVLPAIAPVTTPLLTIAALWTCTAQLGIQALPVGTLAGALAETLLLGWAVHRRGFCVVPVWEGWTAQVSTIWRQYLPLAGGAMVTSSSVIVDQAVAAALPMGSVSALVYGNRLVSVVVTIAVTAIGTAALPLFADLASSRSWRQLRNSATTYACLAFVASLPVVAAIAIWSRPLVQIFFEHGAFSPEATGVVANIQRYAALQLPCAMALAVGIRLATALQASSVLVRVAVIGFMVNVVLDLALARTMGIAGIALSSALVQAVALATIVVLLVRSMRRLPD